MEPWRGLLIAMLSRPVVRHFTAIQSYKAFKSYRLRQGNGGNSSVFSSEKPGAARVLMAILSHCFKAKNFWSVLDNS
jgi:hypothetical protein